MNPGGRTFFYFVTDLHGHTDRYLKLFDLIRESPPRALLLGGDLLPSGMPVNRQSTLAAVDFLESFLYPRLEKLKSELSATMFETLVILGNDDVRLAEQSLIAADERGLLAYINNRRLQVGPYPVYGYSFVPPTPFFLKDWERYDVSRYVDAQSIHPRDGFHSVPASDYEIDFLTIQEELAALVGDSDLSNAIFLFHTPPYGTSLDLADIGGQMIDHAPLDPHVGSIAVRRLIESRQPLVTLHGHIHESPRLSGSWNERIGRTWMFSATHDGPELCVVSFDPGDPASARRDYY
jgi:Icc-related predicted phosphoesterase